MTEQQQSAADILAYFTAMNMYINSGSLNAELIELAYAQGSFMVNTFQNYFVDRCIDLAEEEDIALGKVLLGHNGYQYWRQVERELESYKEHI
jgi:hypothetical protein